MCFKISWKQDSSDLLQNERFSLTYHETVMRKEESRWRQLIRYLFISNVVTRRIIDDYFLLVTIVMLARQFILKIGESYICLHTLEIIYCIVELFSFIFWQFIILILKPPWDGRIVLYGSYECLFPCIASNFEYL